MYQEAAPKKLKKPAGQLSQLNTVVESKYIQKCRFQNKITNTCVLEKLPGLVVTAPFLTTLPLEDKGNLDFELF